MHWLCRATPTPRHKKWGVGRGTFKEYICEELACYSVGMTTNMKQNFKFVNISRNAYHNVTTKCLEEDYTILLGSSISCPLCFYMTRVHSLRMTPGSVHLHTWLM
jgi:hypothetical protein